MATQSIRLSDGTNTLLPESATSTSNYQKNADGTLLCWGQVASGGKEANATAKIDITFPVAFSSNPKIFASIYTAAPANKAVGIDTPSTTGFTLCFYSTAAMTAPGQALWWLAIGRWK